MGNILKLAAALLLPAFILAGCEDDDDPKDATDVAFFVSPTALKTITMRSGDKQLFDIELHTLHNYISRFLVVSTDAMQGQRTLADEHWTSALDKWQYEYTAPVLDRDSLDITLTFTAWDDAGSKGETTRRIHVVNSSPLMGERTGIVLYGGAGLPNGLAFADPSQTFYANADMEPVRADMYIDAEAGIGHATVRTATDARFVRFNSFDYAAATGQTLQTAFAGARRDNIVGELRLNDIVLVGHADRAEGVFRVSNIVKTEGEECLTISFKGIQMRQGSDTETDDTADSGKE